MKNLKISVMILIACLFLTGCGCSKSFTVSFDANGGTTVESQIIKKGDSATEPKEPTREGYTFEGWYIDLEEDIEYVFGTEIDEDIILKAKWVKVKEDKPSDDKTEKVCNLVCEEGYKLVNGNSENCKCQKINVEVSKLTLNKSNVSLVVGESVTIKATVSPSNATNKTVSWKTSDSKIATVKNGKVVAVSPGKVTITATVGDKTKNVVVTVISKGKASLDAALNSITAKTISKGNTSINYSYDGCTIVNSSNIVSTGNSGKTTIANGVVKTLYRTLSSGSISSTYNVTCDELIESKTVKHTIPASTYSYTSSYNGMLYIISVGNATDYTLSSDKAGNLKYLASAGGAQTPVHTPGTEYTMKLNSDANTIYAVKSAE